MSAEEFNAHRASAITWKIGSVAVDWLALGSWIGMFLLSFNPVPAILFSLGCAVVSGVMSGEAKAHRRILEEEA